jgi:hypothetical protein
VTVNKQLILFIQSDTTDLYVNVLTHCVNHEGVTEVYFAINEGSNEALSEAKDQIRKMRERFGNLITETSQNLQEFQKAYEKTLDKVPTLYQVEIRIIRIVYSRPEISIKEVKKYFPNTKNVMIDISGCSRRVSSDIIASFMSNGISQIRHFELDSKVYREKIERIYHSLYGQGLLYYEYIDFSKPGTTTISSFKRMRFQGNIIKILLALSLFLGISVIFLIQQNQTSLATLASILFSGLTAIGLILGVLNDSFDFFERFE